MTIFDDALKDRFTQAPPATTVDVTSADTLLIHDTATGTVMRLPVSVLTSALGSAFASLVDGKVPASQLPSYVDDVLEYANLGAFPATGESGKIYVSLATNLTYRWSGSAYVEISASPGTTDSVTEGATNKYYTDARARAAVSASGSLSYNPTTGVFSFTDAVTSVAGKTGAVTLAKADVGLSNVENTALSTWAGSSNLTTLGILANALRLNNSFAIWDTATGAAAGKDLTWRMNVAGGNPISILGRLQPSSYTLFKGTPQNVMYLYVGAWNNNDSPGTPVATFGSNGDVDFKGRVYAPNVSLTSLPTYADNAAAIAGGLAAGTLYKTSVGDLMIVV